MMAGVILDYVLRHIGDDEARRAGARMRRYRNLPNDLRARERRNRERMEDDAALLRAVAGIAEPSVAAAVHADIPYRVHTYDDDLWVRKYMLPFAPEYRRGSHR